MGQSLESRGHHMHDRAIFVAEYLRRDFERTFRLTPDQIEHLGFAIAVMLDQLIRAITMVVEDAAMSGQDQLNVEALHFQLRIDEIAERIADRQGRIESDMWRNLREQVVPDNHDLFLAQVDYAMTGSVARRPDDLERAIPNRDEVAVIEEPVGLRERIVHVGPEPHWTHPFRRMLVDREAMCAEEFHRVGP